MGGGKNPAERAYGMDKTEPYTRTRTLWHRHLPWHKQGRHRQARHWHRRSRGYYTPPSGDPYPHPPSCRSLRRTFSTYTTPVVSVPERAPVSHMCGASSTQARTRSFS